MKHPERVEDYLAHIVEAIERTTSYVQPLPDFRLLRFIWSDHRDQINTFGPICARNSGITCNHKRL
jgi:hypothetical protein